MAALRSYCVEKDYEDYGYLENDHCWDFVSKNNIIERKEIDKIFQIYCGRCFLFYETDRKRWDTKLERIELMEGSVQFCVSCAGCGREMEFGWSQPNRSGLIWPVECNDFNPQRVWPEPRFRENWSKKGWISTGLTFDSFRSESRFSAVLNKIRLKKSL
jgi:hypothetical protein